HTRCLSDWSSDVCSSDLELRVSETVSRPLPEFTDWRNTLAIPRRIDLSLIDQFGTDKPGIRDLNAGPWPQPIGWNRWQWRVDERSEERRVGKGGGGRWCG